jgi:hypothetical protein
MQTEFTEIKVELSKKATQDSLDRLTNTLDAFAKRLENNEIEDSSRDLQFNRLLDWAREVSAKTGIPLKNL